MKDIVIKILIVVLGVSAYFNVSQYYENKQLEETNILLAETIVDIVDNQPDDTDTCQKIHEITIEVISEDDDFDQSFTICTNAIYLGDALDEVIDDMEVVYDPNFDKDYVYGRLVVSFYGLTKEYEEYYQITVNGDYSPVGLDFIEIEDGSSYEFTLVRWS